MNLKKYYNKTLALKICKIAIPTWGAFFTKDLLGIVDMLFVSRLGASSIAAVSLSGIIMGIIFMMGSGITSGTIAMVTQFLGAGKKDKAIKVSSQSVTISFVVGLIIAAVFIPSSKFIVTMMGAKGDVITQGSQYLSIMAFGSIFLLVLMSLETSIRGNHDAITPFKSMMVGNVVNFILDPLLIYGYGPFPRLEVAGSAIATVIGQLSALGILTYSMIWGKNKKNIIDLRFLVPEWENLKKIWKIGVFSSAKMLIMNFHGLLLMRLVASFGTVALAAFGIGLRLRILIFGPSMGFGMAASILTGNSIGADKPEKAQSAIYHSMFLVILIVSVFSIIFFSFPEEIISVFTDDHSVLNEGIVFLKWFSLSFITMAIGFVLGKAMDGAGYTVIPMLIHAVTLILFGLPSAYFLVKTSLGIKGIWLSIVISNFLLAIALWFDFLRNKWIHKEI